MAKERKSRARTPKPQPDAPSSDSTEELPLQDPSVDNLAQESGAPQTHDVPMNIFMRKWSKKQVQETIYLKLFHPKFQPNTKIMVGTAPLQFPDENGYPQTDLVTWKELSDQDIGKLVGGGETLVLGFDAHGGFTTRMFVTLPGNERTIRYENIVPYGPTAAMPNMGTYPQDPNAPPMPNVPPLHPNAQLPASTDPAQGQLQASDPNAMHAGIPPALHAQGPAPNHPRYGVGVASVPTVFGPVAFLEDMTPETRNLFYAMNWSLHREREMQQREQANHDRLLSFQEQSAHNRSLDQQQANAQVVDVTMKTMTALTEGQSSYFSMIQAMVESNRNHNEHMTGQFFEQLNKLREDINARRNNDDQSAFELLKTLLAKNEKQVDDSIAKLNAELKKYQELAEKSKGEEKNQYLKWAEILSSTLNTLPAVYQQYQSIKQTEEEKTAKMIAVQRWEQLAKVAEQQRAQLEANQNASIQQVQQVQQIQQVPPPAAPPMHNPVAPAAQQPAPTTSPLNTPASAPTAADSPVAQQSAPSAAQPVLPQQPGIHIALPPEEMQKLEGKPYCLIADGKGGIQVRILTEEEIASIKAASQNVTENVAEPPVTKVEPPNTEQPKQDPMSA